MKVSLKWINEFVEIKDYFQKPQELAALLTNAGLEVESIENQAKQFQQVVVGAILEKKQHPDADKLSVCQVSTGGGVVHQIVCGAKNHNEGDKVVVALPGAQLPIGLNIQATQLRGVASNGMLCSEKELGLSQESSGLLILPTTAKVGEDFATYQGLDDIFFELKVTPNRADCLSHFGLARELACLLDRTLSSPLRPLKTSQDSTKKLVQLQVENGDLCPRYAGRVIKNVKVGPSPKWLQQRLEALGMNSINNVVDVTNYVMLEWGQPLHAFDLAFLKGHKIRVALAKEGEKFTSLDGTEYKLDGSELMIYDGEKPVAMAGVVGGKNSGVSENTTDLFIECAYFVPQTVRRSSRKHGIETDSGYRFSRGVDPTNTVNAMDRCCELILQVTGGEALSDHHDFYPTPIESSTIQIDPAFAAQKIGSDLSEDRFATWLKRLGCTYEVNDQGFEVTPPSFRVDLNIAEDLIEEYARLEGYNKIKENPPFLAQEPSANVKVYDLTSSIRNKLSHYGYNEALNFNFVNKKQQQAFIGDVRLLEEVGLATTEDPIQVLNPLSEDFAILRTNLSYSLFNNLLLNYRRGGKSGSLFELGYVFRKGAQSYHQSLRLAMLCWGRQENLWKQTNAPNVFQLKSDVENLLLQMGIAQWEWKQTTKVPSFLHPAQTAQLLVQGKSYGVIGSIHPKLKTEEKIREEVALVELDIEGLQAYMTYQNHFTPLVPYPAVERDLAFVCDSNVAAGEIQAFLYANFKDTLVHADVFDAFEGGSLPKGKKSLGFRLLLQDKEKTMSEEQLLELQSKIIQSVKDKFGADVR